MASTPTAECARKGHSVTIDIFTHFFPKRYLQELSDRGAGLGAIAGRMKGLPAILDLEARFRAMDVLDDYKQIVALPNPAVEDVASPTVAADLARIGNDDLALIVDRHADRFPAFVASVSLLDIDAALTEIRRAIEQLGAKGIQIYSNIAGKPLDLPEFLPIFRLMADYDLPIWLHPTRTAAMSDYRSEAKSRYEMWWCFGWPYETSVAMARLAFSGIFDRHPDLKIITHHLGGMVPFYEGRLGPGMKFLGNRTPDEDYSTVLTSLKKPHMDYFRMFYADTAMFGGAAGLPTGLTFFGTDRIVFATDAPFAPVRETFDALNELDLAAQDRQKILEGNARKLLKLSSV
ncbi:amidohydrolase 2 family protein (plasmid) [Rhizobium etli 8C-3]|uniref:Amidohydrolase 2 family protein n=1 Tax=Rhizobium etli 8C-3 TaxID=538025 RepID=A0A1L5PAD6_RHIET|nr:amidohydrolase 2 family protein [Rhizobium etli 8C-3]